MRIQVQLDKRGEEIISEIKQAAEKEDMSYRELFDNAMAFLYWGVQQLQEGRTIASLDENEKNYKQVTMPLFDRVKAKPKAMRAASARA
jgi:hypothetical protein